jgi:hypothetical protein
MPVEQIAGQYQATPQAFADGQTIAVQVDEHGFLKTVDGGAAPVGGGITWTKTAVTMTGASAALVAANADRKGLIVSSTATNAGAAIDITGGTAALDAGIPLAGGGTIVLTGSDCPVGAITQIGTNAQLLTVYEGT